MNIELPPIVHKYVDASNAHDIAAILSCFSDDEIVHDEREDHDGKRAIENWIRSTIEKYKFQFKPLTVKGDDRNPIVSIEVSGTFDGSPITIDYHFGITKDTIASLTID